MSPSSSTSAAQRRRRRDQQPPRLMNPAVVAQLAKRSQHPYSSIALAPSRQQAVTAGKDTLQFLRVDPAGVSLLRSIAIAQHFQTAAAVTDSDGRTRHARHQPKLSGIYEDVRDTFNFGLGGGQNSSNRNTVSSVVPAATSAANMQVSVVITDVAWSIPENKDQQNNNYNGEGSNNNSMNNNQEDSSLIATAGSNGVIVIWSAAALMEGGGGAGTGGAGHPSCPPEAILSQHVRAVNRLAWHPTKPGLLLSASQDGTVRLWERRKTTKTNSTKRKGSSSKGPGIYGQMLFGSIVAKAPVQEHIYVWRCRAQFEPKSEAVRDIRWSPFYKDVFALVTASGSLIVYNMHLPLRAVVKMTAHSGEATTLDWHPTQPSVVATGGAGDRCVKVWNLGRFLAMNKDDSNIFINMNTIGSQKSTTDSSTETEKSGHSRSRVGGNTIGSNASSIGPQNLSRHKNSSPKAMLHKLHIAASVTRLRWRPPAFDTFLLGDNEEEDRHESMIAVATAPIKGASAGGSGMLCLWSYHRPFTPLSVVEGHKEGAVTDFDWLNTPQKETSQRPLVMTGGAFSPTRNNQALSEKKKQNRRVGTSLHGSESDYYMDEPVGIWQHVLSVGRDGRCLLQSFVRGDRPISRVPPSCFAMANLSPFQKGYGSLQIFSINQSVPSDPVGQFLLTGLRRDSVTARAPGVFREVPTEEGPEGLDDLFSEQCVATGRISPTERQIGFNVVDQGTLDTKALPMVEDHRQNAITVCPEVVHLSRFAKSYVLHPDSEYTTRVALCLRNSDVAESLRCTSLKQMWKMVASMLRSAGTDGLPENGSTQPRNVMQFAILPTLKSLLEERADAGDVQTCVALSEVLQVIKEDQTTKIPGLDISLVREWYLSYIDLLHDMCLFSCASQLIRSCKDPFIAALNQKSTTIHESCPHCGKPLSADASTESSSARRTCKSCRRRVGLCFVCHEPVKGMYVWCPGCGHGGHSKCALQWFGGLNEKAVREECPTGCGHKCNMVRVNSTFPRSELR